MKYFNRRYIMAVTAATSLIVSVSGAFAAGPIKVAGIYTVPVEQQWVSRIHKAALTAEARGDIEYTFSENVSNTDYARVMRELSLIHI